MLIDSIHGSWFGGDDVSSGDIPGCYSIKSTEDGAVIFANPYLMVGGVLYEGPAVCSVDGSCIVALKISATGSYSCNLEVYGSTAGLRAAQEDYGHYIVPLYQFGVTGDGEGGKSVSVVCDFRNVPSAAMGEFAP